MGPSKRSGFGRCLLRRLLATGLAAGCFGGNPARAAEETAESPRVEIAGLGWWRNRELHATLDRLLTFDEREFLDSNALDDIAFLANSVLSDRGYLEPVLTLEVTADDGATTTYDFSAEAATSAWPRTAQARSVRLRIDPGVRYHIAGVTFTGLRALDQSDAERYVQGERVLLAVGAPAYSPLQVERGIANLLAELRTRGYADAVIEEPFTRVDPNNGEVFLEITVDEGMPWFVRSVQVSGGNAGEFPAPDLSGLTGQAWSARWRQELTGRLQREFFRRGFPDMTLQIGSQTERGDGQIAVDVDARIVPGQQVRLGPVRITGAEHTEESVLRRRILAEEGDLLDPTQLEEARFRLARLGVFDRVELDYDPVTGPVRSPEFRLEEGRMMEVNVLFGYGSYEQLRGGLEVLQYNLFGHAHRSRLLLQESMKSTRLDYRYTVPELFGESIDGTARIFGLQREELSFVRQEYGGSAQLSWPSALLGLDATVGYTFQALRNLENDLTTRVSDDRHLVVASVDGSLVRDRRDNPLRPTEGYRLFVRAETADPLLGGQVTYQRFEFGGAYHHRLGRGLRLHASLTHGVVTTWGATDRDLPVNKRFFPGGESSIRGYQEGEAAPRGADGRFIGAKTFMLLNLELEQSLTTDLAVVAFVDGLGESARLADYPFNEKLASAGLGLRYYTLIGPVRAEYGRNLNPRRDDPGGTWLFSVGFPF